MFIAGMRNEYLRSQVDWEGKGVSGKCQKARIFLKAAKPIAHWMVWVGKAFPLISHPSACHSVPTQTSWLPRGWQITWSWLLFPVNGIVPWLRNIAKFHLGDDSFPERPVGTKPHLLWESLLGLETHCRTERTWLQNSIQFCFVLFFKESYSRSQRYSQIYPYTLLWRTG